MGRERPNEISNNVEGQHELRREIEQSPTQALGWAVDGKREETDEAIKVLEETGFIIVPVPVEIHKPTFRFHGRTYSGIEEIRELAEFLRDPSVASDRFVYKDHRVLLKAHKGRFEENEVVD